MEQPKLTIKQIICLYEQLTSDMLILEAILNKFNDDRIAHFQKKIHDQEDILDLLSSVLSTAIKDGHNKELMTLTNKYHNIRGILRTFENIYETACQKTAAQLKDDFFNNPDFKKSLDFALSNVSFLK